MRGRVLGGTGLGVSRLGLGLAAIGRPGYINLGHAGDFGADHSWEAVEAHGRGVLDAALAGGVAYFDAARSYGRAEELLGGWLATRDIAPGAVAVGSKWGYTYTAGWRIRADRHEVKDHSLATLRRQLPESRGLLGPWLGLYQVHSATLESGVLDDDAVLDALARLRADGVSVGLTVSGPAQGDVIRRALAVERDGSPLFGVVQATWNVLERSAGAALAEAHAAGRGVIVKEALANGRLTHRNDALPADAHAALAAALPGAGTPQAVALAAASAQPFADVVLSGAATVEQVRDNIAAAALSNRVDLAVLDRLAEEPASYWATRGALTWT